MNALRWLDRNFERIFGGVALGAVIVLVFIGVVIRLLFNAGLPWQEELSRMLFVFALYMGASYGVKGNDHIRVTIVRDLLPARFQHYLNMVDDVIWMLFNLAVVYYSTASLIKMSAFPATSAYLGIDTRIPFAVIPVLTALQTVRLAQYFYLHYIRKNDAGKTEGGDCSC